MPDVDWEKVAESLDDFVTLRKKELVAVDVTVPSRPAVVVGWRAEALAEIIAAARWGLEAQQRGERVWWCEMHASAGRPNADRPPEICEGSLNVAYRIGKNPYDRISCRFTERLLVPLEGEQ